MRLIISILVFVLAAQMSKAQTDSLAMHFRSMNLLQPSLLSSFDFDNGSSSKNSFLSNSNLVSTLPKHKTTAFFCVLENHIQSTSKIPIRMRLGSLDYTNSMEGKNPFDIELSRAVDPPK